MAQTKGRDPMEAALPLWEILVPYRMGRHNVPTPYHREWDAKVMAVTGGLTILRTTKGAWRSPNSGKEFRELMIPVRIACSEDQVREIARITLEHYKQEAVFVCRISDAATVFHRSDFDGSEQAEQLYIVRLWDGMDSLWVDVSDPVSKVEADRIWAEKTCNGTKNTTFQEIDYYRVFPADTKMFYGAENYNALVKAGLIRP